MHRWCTGFFLRSAVAVVGAAGAEVGDGRRALETHPGALVFTVSGRPRSRYTGQVLEDSMVTSTHGTGRGILVTMDGSSMGRRKCVNVYITNII